MLRQHQDVNTDGEQTSDAGSDNAPSEDNLQPEEIAEVIPVMEDPTLAKAIKKKEKADIPKGPQSSSSPRPRISSFNA